MSDLLSRIEEMDHNRGTEIFFLGAGCSKDCNLPLMTEFIRTVIDRFNGNKCGVLKDDYAAYLAYYGLADRSRLYLDRWVDNLEELFTQAHLTSLIGVPGAKKLLDSMTRVIWDVYRQPKPIDGCGYDFLARRISRLLPLWARGSQPRPVIITTNYDLCLEQALLWQAKICLDSINGNMSPPFFFSRVANDPHDPRQDLPESHLPHWQRHCEMFKNYQTDLEVVELIKLHGSVNWFADGSDGAIQTQPRADWGSQAAIFKVQTMDPKELRFTDKEKPLRPLVIPPTLGKSDSNSVITKNWLRAVLAFSKARTVHFIGYSFPPTDAFLWRLIAEGTRENAFWRSMQIVNPACEDASWLNHVMGHFNSHWRANCSKSINKTFFNFAKAIATEKT